MLINLINTLTENIEFGQLNGVISIDLTKAFDLVDHEILIEKLSLYHFDKFTLATLKNGAIK